MENEVIQTSFYNGFWVFVGVVAGTLVNILCWFIIRQIRRVRLKKLLTFEYRGNRELVREWLSQLELLRKQISSDTPERFTYYFRLSKLLTGSRSTLTGEWSIYDFLDFDDLKGLLHADKWLNCEQEHLFNQQVKQIREGEIQKAEAISHLEVFENILKQIDQDFTATLKKLDSKGSDT